MTSICFNSIKEPIAETLFSLYKGISKDDEYKHEGITYLNVCVDNKNAELLFSFCFYGKNLTRDNKIRMSSYMSICDDHSPRTILHEWEKVFKQREDIQLKHFDVFENVCFVKLDEMKYNKFTARFMTEKEIKTIEKYSKWIKHEDCAVCLEATSRTTQCGHFLCSECAEKLIKSHKRLNLKCPVCRKENHINCDCEECFSDDEEDSDDEEA